MKHSLGVLVFLTILCFLRADVTLLSEVDDYMTPVPVNCSGLLDSFAKAASNFTLCSIQYARPIKLCENCIQQYFNFQDNYKILDKVIVNGTTCHSIFVSHDRLEVVLSYYNSITSIWTKGNCHACFDWSADIPKLSNTTQNFYKMFHDTNDCIIHNSNLNKNNSEEICRKCKDKYMKLDNFYKSLSPDPLGADSICMDIVDSMNATRYKWSKTLNCCQLRRSPEIIFLCCTGIITAMPLLFYLVLRLCGPMRDLPNVLRQTRFKQTFLRSQNSGSSD